LLGAEISYAIQNVDQFEFEQETQRLSKYQRQFFSLRIAHLLVKNFSCGKPAATSRDIAEMLVLPERLVQSVLGDLVESGTFSETATFNGKAAAYQPAVDIARLTVNDILAALSRTGGDGIPLDPSPVVQSLKSTLETFHETLEHSPANRLLKDI